MRRIGVRSVLVGLGLLSAGWQGGGDGHAEWSAGEDGDLLDRGRVAVSMVGRVDGLQGAHLVATIDLPGGGGDAVLGLRVDPGLLVGGAYDLPHPGVAVSYTEYDADGGTVFRSTRAHGTLRLSDSRVRPWIIETVKLEITAASDSPDAEVAWRRIQDARLALVGPGTPPDEVSRGSVAAAPAVAGSGCDDEVQPRDRNTYSDDSQQTGGCGGSDDEVEAASPASPGGCAGDDLNNGQDNSGGCDACEGDAVAATPGLSRRPRSRWIARGVRWIPWIVALLFIRGLRRRRRRPRQVLSTKRSND